MGSLWGALRDGLSSAAPMEPQASPPKASIPRVGELCMYLDQGLALFVIQMPQRVRAKPEEVWIPALSCWLRADGSHCSFDIKRNFHHSYYRGLSRWRLRRAVDRFRRMVERTERLIEHYGLSDSDRSSEAGETRSKARPKARARVRKDIAQGPSA